MENQIENNFKNIYNFILGKFNTNLLIIENEYNNIDNSKEDLFKKVKLLEDKLHQDIFNKYNDSRLKFKFILELKRNNFIFTIEPSNTISFLLLNNYNYEDIKDRKDLLEKTEKEILKNHFIKEITDWK